MGNYTDYFGRTYRHLHVAVVDEGYFGLVATQQDGNGLLTGIVVCKLEFKKEII